MNSSQLLTIAVGTMLGAILFNNVRALIGNRVPVVGQLIDGTLVG